MIRLKDLEFSNMFSYGENVKLSLDANPITQLVARNGYGKTSLIYIIQEILFSKNIKGIKKGEILNRDNGSKFWNGSLTFDNLSSGKNYKVSVERRGETGKVKLFENGIDISEHKIPDTYKKIKNIIGRDFEIFSQLTYQSSRHILDFLEATDTNRKKFLINFFSLEKYINIGEALKIKVNEAEKNLLKLQGELSGVQRFLEETKIGEPIVEILVPIVDDRLVTRKGQLLAEISNYEKKAREIDQNNIYNQEISGLVFDMSMPEPNEPTDVWLLEKETLADITKYTTEINSNKANVKKLDISDKCYSCGQPIDNRKNKEMISLLEEKNQELAEKLKYSKDQLDKVQILLKEYKDHKAKYEKNQKLINRFEQLSQLINNDLPKEVQDYSMLTTELRTIDITIKTQEDERRKAEDYNKNVSSHNSRIETLTQQKREFLARQELLQSDIINNKNEVGYLSILRKAFSTTGIVAYKLENLTKDIEESINNYLSELSDGQFQVVFRLSGEKLDIVVVSHGKESPVENISTGESSRIQIAILLAVRKVLSKIGGNSINLLFLDEISGGLDDQGKEILIDVLRKEENLNVFLISHEYTHPLIEKINIVKENTVSRIENV